MSPPATEQDTVEALDARFQERRRQLPVLARCAEAEGSRRCCGWKARSRVTSGCRACRPTVGGVDIPAGTTVMVLNGAANRDPRRFADPAMFDIARPNARHHLAFGRGVHTCLGAPLARAEARASIERLLDRTADIRISERVHGPADARRYQYLPTYMLRGLTHLNLEFTLAEGMSEVPAEFEEAVRDASGSCPERAITVS